MTAADPRDGLLIIADELERAWYGSGPLDLDGFADRIRALTHAATPGDDPVAWEWRWVDEKDRAMTAWKRGDPPPMLDVSDSKGTMRVEVRIAQKEGNGNG